MATREENIKKINDQLEQSHAEFLDRINNAEKHL